MQQKPFLWMLQPRVMREFPPILRRPALVALCGAVLSGAAARAQAGTLALEALAQDWSGSNAAPHCTVDAVSPTCTWPVQSRGRGVLRLTGSRTPAGVLGLLTREEDVPNRAAARRLRDSLSTALRRQGFQEYRCYADDRQWRGPQATVHFTIGATFPNGLLRVAIFATTAPRSIPRVACPDAVPSPAG
jgi:hypothetical protein